MNMSIYNGRKWIAIIWIAMIVIIVVIATLITTIGAYSDKPGILWTWLLPNIIPTTSMIVTSLSLDTADNISKYRNSLITNGIIFWICIGLSMVYLTGISVIILIQAATELPSENTDVGLKNASIGLGAIQGLVIASLTKFFISPE